MQFHDGELGKGYAQKYVGFDPKQIGPILI